MNSQQTHDLIHFIWLMEKGDLYSFVDMDHRIIGVIDMIDHIYDSNQSHL